MVSEYGGIEQMKEKINQLLDQNKSLRARMKDQQFEMMSFIKNQQEGKQDTYKFQTQSDIDFAPPAEKGNIP